MFDYYFVLGSKESNAQQLTSTLASIKKKLTVQQTSKLYIGPSETQCMHDQFINVACNIQSNAKLSEIRKILHAFEIYETRKKEKIIDIDLIIQSMENKALYISNKLMRYCHCLVTLNDLCPNLIISKKSVCTVSTIYHQHEKFNVFSATDEACIT